MTSTSSARAVNGILTAAYWEVGRRVVEFEQGGKARAEYGEALLKRLRAERDPGRTNRLRQLLKRRLRVGQPAEGQALDKRSAGQFGGALHKSGALSAEEYASKRAQIIADI